MENLGPSKKERKFQQPVNCLEMIGGTVYFKDLLHSVRIPKGRPPESVLEDQICARGNEKLRKLRPRVVLILSSHASEQDFEDILTSCSHLLDEEVVAIEASFLSDAAADNEFKAHNHQLQLSEAPGRREFQEAQFAWLQSNEKIVLPCDIDTPATPLRQAMANLDDLMGDVKTTEQQSVCLAYQYMREWMMPGQLGEWLNLIEEKRGEPLPKGLTIPFIVGAWHPGLAQKFTHFGAPATFELVPSRHEATTSAFADVFASVMRTGYITPEQQQVPWPTWS